MPTNTRKLVMLGAALLIILVLSALGLIVLLTRQDGEGALRVSKMTAEEVITAAEAREIDTFDEIMAGVVVISDTDETEVSQRYIDALVGTEVGEWTGWVTDVEWHGDIDGYTVSVYRSDPYAATQPPRPLSSLSFLSLRSLVDPDMEVGGVAAQLANELAAGDKITYRGRVESLYFDVPYLRITSTEVRRVESRVGLSSADLDGVTVKLDKINTCYAMCPSFHLTITGDGKVIYEGREFVDTIGTREGQIREGQVRQILYEFEKVDFFGTGEKFESRGRSHFIKTRISLTTAENGKMVIRDEPAEHPEVRKLYILEKRILDIVGVERWVGKYYWDILYR